MIEDTLEARTTQHGGTLQFPVGLDTRLSPSTSIARFMTPRKDSILIFDDQSNSTKLMTELSLALPSSISRCLTLVSGILKRQYMHVTRSVLENSEAPIPSPGNVKIIWQVLLNMEPLAA